MKKTICFADLGLKPYQEVWDLQETLLQQVIRNKTENKEEAGYLLFTEHPPVYTLGRNGNALHVLIGDDVRTKMGIDYVHTNRGGDITFHGPGQLVAYPILDLAQFKTDISWYLNSLEEVVIRLLRDYGLSGDRSKGETGVWLEPAVLTKARKICAMGIRSSRWVTMHGLALNVINSLHYFDFIIPCGIQHKKVTSLQKELNRDVSMEEVKEKMQFYFEQVFNVRLEREDRIPAIG